MPDITITGTPAWLKHTEQPMALTKDAPNAAPDQPDPDAETKRLKRLASLAGGPEPGPNRT